MSIHKTEAIVIKVASFRSSSLIITFFTPGFGKVRGVVKGVHREGEIRQAGFELFTHAEYVFYEKKRSDLHLISDAAILDNHQALRSRLDGIVYASYFCELVDELTEIHDPHPEIFNLLKTSFHFLPVLKPDRLATLFEIKLIRAMGWLPYLDSCLVCGVKTLAHGFFSVRHGALLCDKCRSKDPASQSIKAPVLAVLRAYTADELEKSLRASSYAAIENQIQILMAAFLNYRLGKILNSKKFLGSIKSALKNP